MIRLCRFNSVICTAVYQICSKVFNLFCCPLSHLDRWTNGQSYANSTALKVLKILHQIRAVLTKASLAHHYQTESIVDSLYREKQLKVICYGDAPSKKRQLQITLSNMTISNVDFQLIRFEACCCQSRKLPLRVQIGFNV